MSGSGAKKCWSIASRSSDENEETANRRKGLQALHRHHCVTRLGYSIVTLDGKSERRKCQVGAIRMPRHLPRNLENRARQNTTHSIRARRGARIAPMPCDDNSTTSLLLKPSCASDRWMYSSLDAASLHQSTARASAASKSEPCGKAATHKRASRLVRRRPPCSRTHTASNYSNKKACKSIVFLYRDGNI